MCCSDMESAWGKAYKPFAPHRAGRATTRSANKGLADEGIEVDEAATCKELLQVHQEGVRPFQRRTKYYTVLRSENADITPLGRANQKETLRGSLAPMTAFNNTK